MPELKRLAMALDGMHPCEVGAYMLLIVSRSMKLFVVWASAILVLLVSDP